MTWIATRKSEQNKAAVDPWTVVHFSVGLAAGLVDAARPRALLAAVAYEVVEQVLERTSRGRAFFKTTQPEVLANVLIDVAVFATGHILGRRWNGSPR